MTPPPAFNGTMCEDPNQTLLLQLHCSHRGRSVFVAFLARWTGCAKGGGVSTGEGATHSNPDLPATHAAHFRNHEQRDQW